MVAYGHNLYHYDTVVKSNTTYEVWKDLDAEQRSYTTQPLITTVIVVLFFLFVITCLNIDKQTQRNKHTTQKY